MSNMSNPETNSKKPLVITTGVGGFLVGAVYAPIIFHANLAGSMIAGLGAGGVAAAVAGSVATHSQGN